MLLLKQVNLRLPGLEEQHNRRIDDVLRPDCQRLGPSAILVGKRPVVLHEQVRKHDLDLVGGKEPPGARVLSVAKAEMLRTGRHELVPMLVPGFLAFAPEPTPVIPLRVFVDRGVRHDGM